MNTTTHNDHVDDGVLIRIMDDQPLPGDDRRHVADCDRCGDRMATLAGTARTLTATLDRTGSALPPPPADLWDRVQRATSTPESAPARRLTWWTGRPILKAAAIALLLVGPLMAEPVRDWVGRTVASIATAVGLAERPPAPPAQPAPESEIAITPVGDRLVIRVAAARPSAALVIRFEDRADAAARLPDPAAGTLVALPDGFRVTGGADDDARYRFAVPAGLTVTVQGAGAEPIEITGTAGEERTIPLTGPVDRQE